VRFISNQSSGKQGYAIAEAAVALGAEVVLVSGPTGLPIPPGAQMRPVETAAQMLKVCEEELPSDIAIFTAAVADWRVAATAGQKIKKGPAGPPALQLAENPDILATIAQRKKDRPTLCVGFAAETQDVIANAKSKLARKGCDLIVANDVSARGNVFGSDANTVHLVSAKGVESWPTLSKDEVAMRLMKTLSDRLADTLPDKPPGRP
jgi:phosphopantothenoylcysteine decarboxylase/phosphopantothenate--cysteine ligase